MKALSLYISAHLLTVIVLCFIVGIWCVPLLSPQIDIRVAATTIVILLFFLSGFFFLQHKTPYVLLLLPLSTLLVGYLHGLAHFQIPVSKQHIYNLTTDNSEAILTGTLKQMVSYNRKMSRAVIELSSVRKKDTNHHSPSHGLVRLSFLGKWPEQILPGDKIIVRADIKRPKSFHTPGSFDYARYLAQKNIWITGYIRSELFIKELTNDQSIVDNLKYLPEILRTHIGTYLDKNLTPKNSSIYRALLLGDRSSISPSVLELFKASGTLHMLAISGLHITIIATLLYFIFYFVLSRSEYLLLNYPVRKIVAILTAPILIIYALLAGMNSPVTRAVLMSIIVLIALCTERKKSPAPLVAAAAFIILVFDPLQLFTVSFQLSFAAIIGILFILPLLQLHIFHETQQIHPQKRLHKVYRYTISAILVSIVATLTTAPIALSVFNRISTIGPLANFILEPLICLWCLPAGIIALPFMLISPETDNLLLQFGTYGIDTALSIATILSSVPFASLFLPSPPAYHILIYYIFLYVCLTGFTLKSKKAIFFFTSLSFVFIIIFYNYLFPSGREANKVSFIDIGQGSATLIETHNSTVLIDGGGSSFATKSVGETVIAPFLWNKGLKTIDAIIITHPDADHYNGLKYIVDKFSPTQIWARDLYGHDQNYKRFINYVQQKEIDITVPKKGDVLQIGDTSLRCLENLGNKHFQNTRSGHSANTGLVLKGCFEEHCFLFPGDINISMEQFLLQEHIDLKADTLLSAHHGSKTSNSLEFLKEISPLYTIVSAGQSSKGYFPHQSFLDKCASMNIEVLNTSQDGTIEFTISKNSSTISTTKRFQQNPLYPLTLRPENDQTDNQETKKPE